MTGCILLAIAALCFIEGVICSLLARGRYREHDMRRAFDEGRNAEYNIDWYEKPLNEDLQADILFHELLMRIDNEKKGKK